MKKHLVKLSLDKKSVPVKIEFGRHVQSKMNGNTNFVSPSPTLAELKTATDELEAAFDAAQGAGPLQTSLMKEKEAVWDTLMTAMGDYVDNIARGEKAIIESAGMETRKVKSPSDVPQRVTGVEVTSVRSGELDVTWTPIHEAYAYLGYIKLDSETNELYKFVIKTTRSYATVSGLRSGSKYCIVIEALGTAGVGALSDMATSYVL